MFENKNPIEKLLNDGGNCAIFRTIGVIGDSLSSGEHESRRDGVTGWHDYYEYSWGQFIARTCGSTVYNFSSGGMTAQNFMNKQGVWDRLTITAEGKKCQAYIIALGVNDINRCNNPDDDLTFGTIDDVHPNAPETNAKTYAGYMGQIMSLIKSVEPKARIFLMTMPKGSEDEVNEYNDMQQALMYRLAELFEFTYVIDFRKYAPPYDNEFRHKYYLGYHLNAMGYLLTAKMVMTYIDAIINENIEDFVQVGFIGKDNDLHHEERKW